MTVLLRDCRASVSRFCSNIYQQEGEIPDSLNKCNYHSKFSKYFRSASCQAIQSVRLIQTVE